MRIRDGDAGVMVVHRVLAFAGGSAGIRSLLWSFSIVRVSWRVGADWMRRMVLYLSSGRFRQGPIAVFGPRTVSGNNAAGFEDRISTVIDERCVLHVHELNTPTLSPKCQQPSHQSVSGNRDIARSHTPQGLSRHRVAVAGDLSDDRLTDAADIF